MSAIQDRCGEVQPHFLAGQWRWGGPPIDVHAPYDESVITRVSSAGPDEAREAVDAAAEALAGEATYIGPVINRGERDRSCGRVEETRWSGATIAAGGGLRDELPPGDRGPYRSTWRADPIPFGGVKESGNTREGPLVKEMTESRLVVVGPG